MSAVCPAGFNDIVNETFKVGANAHNPAMLRVVAKEALFLEKQHIQWLSAASCVVLKETSFNHNEYILCVFPAQHLVASAAPLRPRHVFLAKRT